MHLFGLELLVYADGIASRQREEHYLKLALTARDGVDLRTLYPAWFALGAAEAQARTAPAPQTTSPIPGLEEYGEIEWKSPSDVGGIEEYERLAAEVFSNTSVTLTEADDEGWV